MIGTVVTSVDIAGVPADRIRITPSPLAELGVVLHVLASRSIIRTRPRRLR